MNLLHRGIATGAGWAQRRQLSYLANAHRVVVIPGYGMAVSQAQHRVRDIYDQLMKRGASRKP